MKLTNSLLKAVLASLCMAALPAFALTVPVAEDIATSTVSGNQLLRASSGKSTTLPVNIGQKALVRFNLNDLDVVPAPIKPGNIKSAVLRFYIVSAKPAGALHVRSIDSSWSEVLATYTANPPTISGPILATVPVEEVLAKKFVTVDVTAAVVTALQSGNSFGFSIETSEALAKIVLSSKEGPAAGYSAQLDIEANLADNGTGTISADSISAGTLTGSTLVTDNIALPNTSGSTGIIYSGTVPVFNFNESKLNFFMGKAGNFTMQGGYNIAFGPNALDTNTLGIGNLAIGYNSLTSNTGGNYNTAVGNWTMTENTSGIENTAFGYHCLANNITGSGNTAVGKYALLFNTTSYNTGIGFEALYANATGTNNTAVGAMAMRNNLNSSDNTALGFSALKSNYYGISNTAIGSNALANNASNLNTALGSMALLSNTAGYANTAVGASALNANTDGFYNTAVGERAMRDSMGSQNSAFGVSALMSNQANSNNAFGYLALKNNTSGYSNAAFGFSALLSNTTGYQNVALGNNALASNGSGINNTATGHSSLRFNTTGNYNAANGQYAMYANTSGVANTALGANSLFSSVSGTGNVAIGYNALLDNSTGSFNIAIGYNAGWNLTGDWNIAIGNSSVAGETKTIRIGNSANHNRAFLSGIRGIATGNADAIPVMVDSAGQLGTVSSSRRYKEEIQDMGEASTRLLSLRPVTFRYKQAFNDGSKPLQFGLIAEEVAQTFPELAVFNDQGQPETVKYQDISAILLNEVIKEHRRNDQQAQSLARQQEVIAAQSEMLDQQKAQIQKLTSRLSEMAEQVERISAQMNANRPGTFQR